MCLKQLLQILPTLAQSSIVSIIAADTRLACNLSACSCPCSYLARLSQEPGRCSHQLVSRKQKTRKQQRRQSEAYGCLRVGTSVRRSGCFRGRQTSDVFVSPRGWGLGEPQPDANERNYWQTRFTKPSHALQIIQFLHRRSLAQTF